MQAAVSKFEINEAQGCKIPKLERAHFTRDSRCHLENTFPLLDKSALSGKALKA